MFYTLPVEQLLNRPTTLPPRNETVLPLIVSTTTVLILFALSTFIGRICMRWPNKLGLDDLTMSLAVLCTCVTYGAGIAIVHITGGRHTVYVNAEATLVPSAITSFVFVLVWMWAVTLVKVSVCCALLRVKSYSRVWRYGLWGMIGVLVALTLAVFITHLLMCRPIKANWTLIMMISPGYCWSVERFVDFTKGWSSVFIMTDIICAFLPITFVWKIHRPLRERIVLGCLMGLGLLASFCGIMKLIAVEPGLNSSDPVFSGANTQIWAIAEACVGIFAANIPSLKTVLEKALKIVTGRTINSLRSLSGRMQGSNKQSGRIGDDEYELSRSDNSRMANHGVAVEYHTAVYSKGHRGKGWSEEQLESLPQACYVDREFRVVHEQVESGASSR